MANDVTRRYRRIVERFITEGFVEGRLDVFDELCDPGVINHAAMVHTWRWPTGRSSSTELSRMTLP